MKIRVGESGELWLRTGGKWRSVVDFVFLDDVNVLQVKYFQGGCLRRTGVALVDGRWLKLYSKTVLRKGASVDFSVGGVSGFRLSVDGYSVERYVTGNSEYAKLFYRVSLYYKGCQLRFLNGKPIPLAEPAGLYSELDYLRIPVGEGRFLELDLTRNELFYARLRPGGCLNRVPVVDVFASGEGVLVKIDPYKASPIYLSFTADFRKFL